MAAKKTTQRTESASKKSTGQSASAAPHSGRLRRWGWVTLKISLVLVVALAAYAVYLDAVIQKRFQGQRWELPAHVYSRAMDFYAGQYLTRQAIQEELDSLGYHKVAKITGPGQYHLLKQGLHIYTRGFTFWDGVEASRHIALTFDNRRIATLRDVTQQQPLDWYRLEPRRIAGLYNDTQEDRILLKLEQVPLQLIQALLVSEDRGFYEHAGISVKGISRALYNNLVRGGPMQGGSTITQQLVKNYFLTSERTVWRKAREAIMALLLELHYSKDEILQAYLNEIYLGQDGARAIHGFALASEYYFSKPIAELSLSEACLLVSLVRGPSYYHPGRNPERAQKRRDLILSLLHEQQQISEQDYQAALQSPVKLTQQAKQQLKPLPAFLALLKQQLQVYYQEHQLDREGLRLFTTLDPRIQKTVELLLPKRLEKLERKYKMEKGSLQAAVVILEPETGHVLAMVGGRKVDYAGFNRAIDAKRPIGSLIKPAVFLSALQQPEEFSLLTQLYDRQIEMTGPDGQRWKPNNYDKQEHGEVPLYLALAKSYNLATINLGLRLGISTVIETLHGLGVEAEMKAYPSLLLGALELSPFEVAQMYQTIAAKGFYQPLSSVKAVVSSQTEQTLTHKSRSQKRFDQEAVFLLNLAMQETIFQGTATSFKQRIPYLTAAGKTGTTDDLRDSWFAGYSEGLLGVVWIGRDDNLPTKLTGSTGALQVWIDIVDALQPKPLQWPVPPGIQYARVDQQGQLIGEGCEPQGQWPFYTAYLPKQGESCVVARKDDGFFSRWFD